MLFVYKFFSHLKYYNITHNIPDLVFKSDSLFNMNQVNACLFKVNIIRTKFEICSQLTIKILERRDLHR